jgi:AcrR family transcriptional regulator
MPRRQLEDEEIVEFRERLTRVAAHLFAERGYEGLTLRSIAAELGCSPMTPYRYFKDKREIFAAVRAAALREFAAAQEQARLAEDEPVAQLAALGRAYVRFGIEHPEAYRLMFELDQPLPDDFPELREASRAAWLPIRSAVEAVVEVGVLEGDPDVVAHVFWSGVHGIVSLQLAGKLNLGCSIDELVDPMLMTLLRGNLAPQGAPQ